MFWVEFSGKQFLSVKLWLPLKQRWVVCIKYNSPGLYARQTRLRTSTIKVRNPHTKCCEWYGCDLACVPVPACGEQSYSHVMDLNSGHMKRNVGWQCGIYHQVLIGNIIQCLYHIQIWYYQSCFYWACSILTLNPFLCLVFWLVLVFVNAPVWSCVCTHFIAAIVAVPLILDNTQKPSQVLW